MKFKKITLFFFVVTSFFLTVSPGIINAESVSFTEVNSVEKIQFKVEYTYVKVYENGSWWIFVYDGLILIDRYWIED